VEDVLKTSEPVNRFKTLDDDEDWGNADDNERDDAFNLEIDLRKSTDNLRQKTALSF